MIEAAHPVLLHSKRIGTLLQRGDVARFVFAEGYWEDSNRYVLGLAFENNPRNSPQAALRLPPWFSNLLPEGRLREFIAHDQGVKVTRELQLLLRIGHDLPGAVEVLPAASDEYFDPDVLSKSTATSAAIQSAESPWKFSLAGVGLKMSLLKQGDRLTIPATNSVGDWIAKFPDAVYPQVPANELATMQLARRVGIEVPEIALVHRDELPNMPSVVWPNGETYAFTIARFDRGPDKQRIHIEDFAQVRGFYDSRKYEGTFETVAALAYRNRDLPALHEFVRRLTFNLLVGNGDSHLKNWSLIYPDGRIPTLSPVYDLVSTGPYASAHAPDDFGLAFGGTKLPERIGRRDFQRLQRKLDVASADVIDIVDETLEAFSASWEDGARETYPPFIAQWIDAHLPSVQKQLSR